MKIPTIIFAIFLVTSVSYSHGSDKPGPHGGYITMPGPFHTEVKPNADQKSIQVYLLDVNIKDPTINKSKVSATFKFLKASSEAVCSVGTDFFDCVFPDNVLSMQGELIIKSNRLGVFEGVSIYQIPFAKF